MGASLSNEINDVDKFLPAEWVEELPAAETGPKTRTDIRNAVSNQCDAAETQDFHSD